jgi:hypothetical protein
VQTTADTTDHTSRNLHSAVRRVVDQKKNVIRHLLLARQGVEAGVNDSFFVPRRDGDDAACRFF